jgi:hypothetical protein
MTSADLDLLNAFRSEVPFPDAETMDEILQRVVSEERRGRPGFKRLTRRQRLTLALAVATLVIAAGAVAAVKEVPWWQSGSPPVDPQSVVSVARDNLPANVVVADARTVATADNAALVAVPLNKTGYCLIPSLAGTASLGAQCVYEVRSPQRGDEDSTRSATRPATTDGAGAWLVYGRITDPRAASIDFGAFSAELKPGGFFLARVPNRQWGGLSNSANPGRILDSSGAILRRGCINWGPSPTATRSTGGGSSSTPLWLESPGPCRPQTAPPPATIDFQRAAKLFDVTLTQNYSVWKPGQTITFFAAPASDGTTCVAATGPGMPLDQTATMMRGHGCQGTTLPRSATDPLHVSISAQLAHVEGKPVYVWSVSGYVDPKLDIAKVQLHSPNADSAVALGGGFFFGQFRETTGGPSPAPGFPTGPHSLVAYDRSENEVARVDLNELHREASPH